MRESIQSHLDSFRPEIAEYERLVECDRTQDLKIEVDSILELPRVLIKPTFRTLNWHTHSWGGKEESMGR